MGPRPSYATPWLLPGTTRAPRPRQLPTSHGHQLEKNLAREKLQHQAIHLGRVLVRGPVAGLGNPVHVEHADGVANLNRRASRAKVATFAALTPLQQDELLHAIEKTPFFKAVRLDTIVGTFALPSWGGNRDYAGWHLLGLEHQSRFQPPFGYYDGEINRRS